MKGLAGKVAIVTGGGQGIGRALVLRLAEEACKVTIFDLSTAAGDETAALAGDATVKTWQVDVSDFAGVEAAVAAVEADLGPVWVLVNNAGWDKPQPFLATDPAFWDKVIAINLTGNLNTHFAVAGRMAQRGGGRIINIASDAAKGRDQQRSGLFGMQGRPDQLHQIDRARTGAQECTGQLRLPGPTNTPMMASVVGEGPDAEKWKDAMVRGVPLKRMGEPEDYAGIVALPASDDGAYITGQAISVSCGMNMV